MTRTERYYSAKCPWCGHNGDFPPCGNCGYENLWVGPSRNGSPAFRGGMYFLSNFFPGNHATTEHLFQACKTLDPREQLHVLASAYPGIAKRRGRGVTLRDDWEEIKEAIMLDLLMEKFPNKPGSWMAEQLLATGDRDLIETNNWHDTHWGVCNGFCRAPHNKPRGKNVLGKLLMEVRGERDHLR